MTFTLTFAKGSYVRALVDPLHGLCSQTHVLQDLCVGVRVLQGFSLELDGRQRPIDLGELLLQSLFPLQRLQGN